MRFDTDALHVYKERNDKTLLEVEKGKFSALKAYRRVKLQYVACTRCNRNLEPIRQVR